MEMKVEYKGYVFTLNSYKKTGAFMFCLKKDIEARFVPHEFAKFELIDLETLGDDERMTMIMDGMVKRIEWAIDQVISGKQLPLSWYSYSTTSTT